MINEDKALRDKLRNYESPVPKDLWNRIQEAQSTKKRAPVAGFLNGKWLGFVVSGVILIAVGYFMANSSSVKDLSDEMVQVSAIEKATIADGHSGILQGGNDLSNPSTSNQESQVSNTSASTINANAPVSLTLPAQFSEASSSNKKQIRRGFDQAPSLAVSPVNGNVSPVNNDASAGLDGTVANALNANESLESLIALSTTAETNQRAPWDGNKKARIKTRRSGKSTYTIDLLGGMGGWTSSMKLREGFNQVNLDRRKETEIPLYATSLTLRTALIQPSGFAFYGGVSYSQLIDLFEYNYRTLAPSPTDPNELVPGNRLKKTYNRFHQVDIPIGAGYEFKWKRWSLAMRGGVAVNVYAWQKGEILLPGELDPSSITTGTQGSVQVYRTNTGFQGWASIGLQKNVGPSSQIMIEPYLSQHINSLTVSDYALSQRPMRFGIQLGLRKLFLASRQRPCY